MVTRLKVTMKTPTNGTQNEYFYMNQQLMTGTSISNENYEKIDSFARRIKDLTKNTYDDTTVELSISVNEELAG